MYLDEEVRADGNKQDFHLIPFPSPSSPTFDNALIPAFFRGYSGLTFSEFGVFLFTVNTDKVG